MSIHEFWRQDPIGFCQLSAIWFLLGLLLAGILFAIWVDLKYFHPKLKIFLLNDLPSILVIPALAVGFLCFIYF